MFGLFLSAWLQVDAFHPTVSHRLMVRDQNAAALQSSRTAVTRYLIDPRISPHLQGSDREDIGVIVVDHGSKREKANAQLIELVAELKIRSNRPIIEPAHMELAAPSIQDAYAACVEQGAKKIIIHPYFLSSGRHATEDIPALVEEAASQFSDVQFVLTKPLGASPMIPDLIVESLEGAVFEDNTEGGWKLGGFFGDIMDMVNEVEVEGDADADADVEYVPEGLELSVFMDLVNKAKNEGNAAGADADTEGGNEDQRGDRTEEGEVQSTPKRVRNQTPYKPTGGYF